MSECIIWGGNRWSQGRYGVVTVKGKSVSAHRQAWIDKNGEIPDGLFVCHKCDVPLCVNPDHLFLGTPKDNSQDCKNKGRLVLTDQKGANNHNAKPHIISKYKEIQDARLAGFSYSQICATFGLKSKGHLRQILLTKL